MTIKKTFVPSSLLRSHYNAELTTWAADKLSPKKYFIFSPFAFSKNFPTKKKKKTKKKRFKLKHLLSDSVLLHRLLLIHLLSFLFFIFFGGESRWAQCATRKTSSCICCAVLSCWREHSGYLKQISIFLGFLVNVLTSAFDSFLFSLFWTLITWPGAEEHEGEWQGSHRRPNVHLLIFIIQR